MRSVGQATVDESALGMCNDKVFGTGVERGVGSPAFVIDQGLFLEEQVATEHAVVVFLWQLDKTVPALLVEAVVVTKVGVLAVDGAINCRTEGIKD